MKTLNREAIQRMVGVTGGSAGGVGGGGGGSLSGYATGSWVNENYLSIEFFGNIFQINGQQIVERSTDGGTTWTRVGTPTTFILAPNEVPTQVTTTDPETGIMTRTTRSITDIKANHGLWTQDFLSALGLNSGGGGGGGVTLNEPLASINMAGLSAPTASEIGKTIVWDGTTWGYGAAGGGGGSGTVTNIATGTGLTGGPITTSGTIAIDSTYLGYITHGEDAYWSLQNYLKRIDAANTYLSKTDAANTYLKIDFFRSLFRAYNSSGTEVQPNAGNTATIDNIKAMFGFWTEQYLSALGQNSSGGGGGGAILYEPLLSINDEGLGNPEGINKVLLWNGDSWTYGTLKSGTVTSIIAGTGLSGGTITNSGTIAINSTYQSYISHGETAYGWGDHANAGYLTSLEIGAYSWWGRQLSSGVVEGTIEAGNNGGIIRGFGSIELNTHDSIPHGETPGYGGFIDFHFNGSSNDYTTRLVEDASGVLHLYGKLRIGNAIIEWDTDNNCLKITGGVYTTSFLSALGANASTVQGWTGDSYDQDGNLLHFENGILMYLA